MGADTRGPTSQSENIYGPDVSYSEHSFTFGSLSFFINKVGIITPNLCRVFCKTSYFVYHPLDLPQKNVFSSL